MRLTTGQLWYITNEINLFYLRFLFFQFNVINSYTYIYILVDNIGLKFTYPWWTVNIFTEFFLEFHYFNFTVFHSSTCFSEWKFKKKAKKRKRKIRSINYSMLKNIYIYIYIYTNDCKQKWLFLILNLSQFNWHNFSMFIMHKDEIF